MLNRRIPKVTIVNDSDNLCNTKIIVREIPEHKVYYLNVVQLVYKGLAVKKDSKGIFVELNIDVDSFILSYLLIEECVSEIRKEYETWLESSKTIGIRDKNTEKLCGSQFHNKHESTYKCFDVRV